MTQLSTPEVQVTAPDLRGSGGSDAPATGPASTGRSRHAGSRTVWWPGLRQSPAGETPPRRAPWAGA
jgi:hypothetical protein